MLFNTNGREWEVGMDLSPTLKLALQIIEKNKEKFKFIELNSNYVDGGILKYIENNKDEKFVVATIDKGLKRNLKKMAKLLIIRAKKKIALE